MSVLYFAYGSNLETGRIRARISSARKDSVACLEHHRLVCNKLGRDGSAKANLAPAAGHRAWGVLYRIDAAHLDDLDRFEGGYQRVEVEVRTAAGEICRATTYRSDRIASDPTPFDWYRALILEGAREHGLPEEHLALLEALPARSDEEPRG